MSELTLGYWDIRGLAEPIRYLLHYKKVKFDDKRYTFDSGEWQEDKFNLGLDFPNLPYLFDGDIKLTQTTTILRYLAQKYKLEGDSERAKVSLVEQQAIDIRLMLFLALFKPDLENGKAELVEKAPAVLEQIEKFLGDRDFLVGDSVTYVDFLWYETFDYYRYFIPEVCRKFPTLIAYQERITSLPGLQEYLNSSTYKRWPLFGPKTRFGGSGEEPGRD